MYISALQKEDTVSDSKATKTEKAIAKEKAIAQLRDMFRPGDTVTTVLRHVSSSGMTRAISVISPDLQDISWMVARATGDTFDQRYGGIKVGGCGMDMGFHLVYGLSRTLYPSYACIGKGNGSWHSRCPSNTHVNPGPDKDNFSPTVMHTDGYALSHRWL